MFTFNEIPIMRLGVFPLPIVLLPGGITRLRIFEARYIRLVKEASSGQGFALSVYLPEGDFNTSTTAAWVEIVDFDMGDDGLMTIDVKAKCLVELSNFSFAEDNLRYADVRKIEHWKQQSVDPTISLLSKQLRNVFTNVAEFKNLYPNPEFNRPNWVCARFVELLPLSIEKKIEFLAPDSFEDCVRFLHTVINGENEVDPDSSQERRPIIQNKR